MTKGFGPSARFGEGSHGNGGFISASHSAHRQRWTLEGCGARTMLRHWGSTWETMCTVSRPCIIATAASAARAAVRRFEGDEFVGTMGSLRRGHRLEGPGFGRAPNRGVSISMHTIAGESTSESSKSRKAQGRIGRTSSGNTAGEQRTPGLDTPEVGASFEEQRGFGRVGGRREPTTRGARRSVNGPAMGR
jgi:hypothetical protein